MDPLSISAAVASFLTTGAVATAVLRLNRPEAREKKKRQHESTREAATQRYIGLETLFEPKSPDFDICFVHGLHGNAFSTWTTYDRDTDQDIFWPRKLLGKSFPKARILLYGYETEVNSLCWLADRTLYHHANYLLNDLTRAREGCADRPLLFVAHSVGGLLVKSAILFTQDLARPSNEADQKIYMSTSGIISFGTPQIVAGNPPLSDFMDQLCTTSELVQFEDLRSPSWREDMANLQSRLKIYKPIATEIPELFFYENEAHSSKRKSTPVVHDLCKAIPINADHRDMCKFVSSKDGAYDDFCGSIRQFLKDHRETERKRRERVSKHEGPRSIASKEQIRLKGFNVAPDLPALRENLVPRHAYLDQLHRQLRRDRLVMICGRQGSGKTTLALEYAHSQKHAADISSIFWLDAASEKALDQGLLQIHARLRDHYGQTKGDVAATNRSAFGYDDHLVKMNAVIDWLSFPHNKTWILIFDDVKDPDASFLHRFYRMVKSRRGYLLLTTRKEQFEDSEMDKEYKPIRPTPLFQDDEMSEEEYTTNGDLSDVSSSLEAWSVTDSASISSKYRPPMMGLDPSESRGDTSPTKTLFPRPIRVGSFSRAESIKRLERADSPELRAIEPLRRRETLKEVAEKVNDDPEEVSQASELLKTTSNPQRIPVILGRDDHGNEYIPEEVTNWLDACVMLGCDPLPTLLLMVHTGKKQNLVIFDLEELRNINWVLTTDDWESFQIPIFRRRSRSRELQETHRGATSAQQACTSVIKLLKQLKIEDDNETSVKLLLKHMDACADLCSCWANFIQCEWDVLAEFSEHHGLYSEAATFYRASQGRGQKAANASGSAPQSFSATNTQAEDSESERWYDANSSLLIESGDIDLDRSNGSKDHEETKASRKLRNRIGFIRTKVELGEFEGLHAKCRDVMERVRDRKETRYRNLQVEALKQMIHIELAMKDFRSATTHSRELIDALEERKGPSHEETVSALRQLATTYMKQGDYESAEPVLEQIFMTYRRLFGDSDSRTITVSENLAATYKEQGDATRAKSLYLSVIERYKDSLGSEHIRTAKALEGLATVYEMEHEIDDADEKYKEAVKTAKRSGRSNEEYRQMRKRYDEVKRSRV